MAFAMKGGGVRGHFQKFKSKTVWGTIIKTRPEKKRKPDLAKNYWVLSMSATSGEIC